MRFKYKCHDCGFETVTDDIIYLCPHCGSTEKEGEFRKGILSVIYEDDELKALAARPDLGVSDFLPYPIVDADTFPLGPTPVVRSRRIRERYGLDVCFKMDSQLLSGSFKDRASLLVAMQAMAHGQTKIALNQLSSAMSELNEVVCSIRMTLPFSSVGTEHPVSTAAMQSTESTISSFFIRGLNFIIFS